MHAEHRDGKNSGAGIPALLTQVFQKGAAGRPIHTAGTMTKLLLTLTRDKYLRYCDLMGIYRSNLPDKPYKKTGYQDIKLYFKTFLVYH